MFFLNHAILMAESVEPRRSDEGTQVGCPSEEVYVAADVAALPNLTGGRVSIGTIPIA